MAKRQKKYHRGADGRIRDARGRFAPSHITDKTGRWHDPVTGRFVTKKKVAPPPEAKIKEVKAPPKPPRFEDEFRIGTVENIRAQQYAGSIGRMKKITADKALQLGIYVRKRELEQLRGRRPKKKLKEALNREEERRRELRKLAGYQKLENTADKLGISVEFLKDIIAFFHLES